MFVMLLALAMLLTSIPVIALAADKGTTFTYSRGKIIGLGSYPQTEVTDETLKASLTSKAGSTDKWTSYNYYINSEQSDFMKYKDVELDGEKYRGVYFTSYRPSSTDGDGEYNEQEDNGYNTSTIYWFKYEPILWKILSYDATTDTAVVLSQSTIDSQEYYDNTDARIIDGKTIYANNYEYSNIRTWLNNIFYNTAFTSIEKTAIVATALDNSAYSTDYSEYDNNSTTDNVWLFSFEEAINEDYGFLIRAWGTGQAKSTDYAKSQGAYEENTEKGTYRLLRSAGSDNSYVCNVGSKGYLYNNCDVNLTYIGVRPALTLHLKSGNAPSCVHTFTDKTVSSTCEELGYTLYTCTKCKATTKDENTLAMGHYFTGDARVDSNGKYSLHCTVCDKYITPATGDNYKSFGSYPQTEVTDTELKSNLTKEAGSIATWTSYNYYVTIKNFSYSYITSSDFMKYKDIEFDGEKYRGVYFTSYRPYYTGSTGNDEYYIQEGNGYNYYTIYWFKYEPILWRILSYDATTNTAIVLSKSTIDSQEYSHYYTVYSNNYKHSDIRTWLNDTFYNTAFTSTEKKAIVATTLDNSAYSTDYSQYDSNSTTDDVWLLSYDEAMKAEYGFATNKSDYIGNRTAHTTDYAKSQGISVKHKNTHWLLRSAGNVYYGVCGVDTSGDVGADCDVCRTNLGIRPALTIHLICDHDYSSVTTKPTCTEKGLTVYTCKKCQKVYTDNEISELGHDLEHHNAKIATCTENGYDAYDTCSRCDYTTYVEIPAFEHKVVTDPAVAATCTKTGLTEGSHCSVCNMVFEKQETVAALGHTVVTDAAVAATCTKTGLTAGSHCSVCKAVIKKQETVKALGHDFTGTARSNADGTISYKCTRCNEFGGTVKPAEKKLDPVTGTKRLTQDKVDILVAPVEMSAGTVLASANGAKLVDKDGKEVTDKKTLLATGMKVVLGDTSVAISVLGDVDCDGAISVSDARLALRAAVQLDKLIGAYFTAANVDFDDTISVSDARLILRAAVKLDDPKKAWIK